MGRRFDPDRAHQHLIWAFPTPLFLLLFGVFKKSNFSSLNQTKFVWTEAFNCGELLPAFLDSYLKHNHHEINIYAFKSDLEKIETNHPKVILHDLDQIFFQKKPLADLVAASYKKGHLGTAVFWSWLIKTRTENNLVHLDADTIFLGNVIEDFEIAIAAGYDLAGSRRPYRYRGYRKKGMDGWLLNKRKDCLNTDCFYFNKSKITKIPFFWLVRMIRGRRTGPLPVLDFFDPIIFRLLRKKQKILYLDSPTAGFQSNNDLNSQFCSKRISFAAVGSGINFYKNPDIVVPPGYKNYALASYSLYSSFILGIKIPIEPLQDPSLQLKLEKLDVKKWELSS